MPDAPELLDCRHAAICAGCPLAFVAYARQLVGKRDRLEKALQAYGVLTALTVPNTVPASPNTRYRVRVKLVVEGSALGLFHKDGHAVVDIPDCRVMTPKLGAAVAALRSMLPLEFPLLALDAREVDAGVLATLIVPPDVSRARVEGAALDLMHRCGSVVGVALARRAPKSAQVLGSAPEPLVGAFAAPHRLADSMPYHIATPGGFVQAHAGQAAKLYERIGQVLERKLGGLRGRRILELYAGSGALALHLAQASARVVAADSFAPSLSQAREAAAQQGLDMEIREATAEKAVETREPFDAVLVDPPRKGLSASVRSGIAVLRPSVLVYVSCEPRTLARDLAALTVLGLRPESVEPWDMIPQSDAVEALAVLTPAPPPPPRVLYEDERLIAVDKPAQLPTTPQGEHELSLLDAVRKLPQASEAVPVHRLDLGTSGVCLFARRPEYAALLGEALAQGQKEYLGLARGITHKRGRIERALNDGTGVRDAVTRYERTQVVGTHSLVRAMPETGRRHQIRRHFAHIGHPLLGDARYGNPASNRHFEERHGLDRPFLHLERITLPAMPVLRSELAPELAAVLESIEETNARRPRSGPGQKAPPRGE
ncbi:MAG TPA: pseudouridine synthase [Polyangiaceae bacterium]|nr:pseudouridine synthase [Polyangiaceae bacterium]